MSTLNRRVCLHLLGAATLAATGCATPHSTALGTGAKGANALPSTSPADAGLSPARLARIGQWMRQEIAAKRVPGASVMVLRGGKVAYVDVAGVQDPATGKPMARDSIFRIYSMTKPVVSVATMMLVEEGRLLLEAPVARYIPAFANTKVGIEKVDAAGKPTLELVAPRRAMTVHDLLRHTSGLTYGIFGDSMVKRAYRTGGVGVSNELSNAEFADRIAGMPLHFQPGSMWEYSHSTDVLGRVLEVASGQSLLALLKEKLLDPLGMVDTSFYVPEAARQARLAEPLADDRVIGTDATMFDPRTVQKFESGGGGLVSTLDDYARFVAMLQLGGTLDGRRYLSPRTVAFMMADHLGSATQRNALYIPGSGHGFGLGFAVRTEAGEAPFAASVGDAWWAGVGGTYFWIDPRSDVATVWMMQSPKQRGAYRSTLRNLVYGAVER